MLAVINHDEEEKMLSVFSNRIISIFIEISRVDWREKEKSLKSHTEKSIPAERGVDYKLSESVECTKENVEGCAWITGENVRKSK